MNTLAEFIPTIRELGNREAVRWLDNYRTEITTYTELHGRIGACISYLDERGIRKGDRVMVWSENRPEWVALFWACVARGVHLVPVDFRFSPALAERIRADSTAVLTIKSSDFDALAQRPALHEFAVTPASPDDTVEIIYTSGTTGEPKGIVHRHRNICANLAPFAREIDKYRRWTVPFQPIRILNLLPLSHMFGQSMGLYIPVLLGGSVAFTTELHPAALTRMTRKNRISVIVSVPRILEVLRDDVRRQSILPPEPASKGLLGVGARWWKYRNVHSRFGWKFWAFVVGGARLDPDLEGFWTQLGYAVVQGYGLTEASPVVAVNHPFSVKKGALGKPVPGQEVRIAADGEILVRGGSVAAATDELGWLHTGDLGELDAEGRLYYRGRKKDVIVTPDGLNVSPEDVERVLNRLPEIRESAVVSIDDQVHAALILRTPALARSEIEALIRKANEHLESHQIIRQWSVWPRDDFPRTASTLKIRRTEVAAEIAHGVSPQETVRSVDPALMSSLDRVELLTELEARHGTEIDEAAFSSLKTREELERFMAAPVTAHAQRTPSNWPLFVGARQFRDVFQRMVARPLFRHYFPMTVTGLDAFRDIAPPVMFAANHSSHLDTPAIFAALPAEWRKRIAPAMQAEHFTKGWRATLEYGLARLIYNGYPLPQQVAGVRSAFAYTASLVERGYCPLIYPEGHRTADGTLDKFRPGVGMLAVRLRIPVVPVHIAGLFELFPAGQAWPEAGPVRVAFGNPMTFSADTRFSDAALQIEAAVRAMSPQ